MRAYVPIVESRRPQDGEVNCAACHYISDFDDERTRGFCLLLKRMVSTWHPAKCSLFQLAARARRIKVDWRGVDYE